MMSTPFSLATSFVLAFILAAAPDRAAEAKTPGAAEPDGALAKAIVRSRLLPRPDAYRQSLGVAEPQTIAIDGNTAVVGHPASSIANVFVKVAGGDWQLQETLAAPGMYPGVGSGFGSAVAISGDRVIVGAPFELLVDGPVGAAHVFTRSGSAWSHSARLRATDPAVNDEFGASVAIDGSQFAVGAPGDRIGTNSGQGSVSLFEFGLFGSVTRVGDFVASDGAADDRYGHSLALRRNWILVVGSPGDDTARGGNAGSVRVIAHTTGGWTNQFALTNPLGASGDGFGTSLDLEAPFAGNASNYLIVGAPNELVAGIRSGAARVLRIDNYGGSSGYVEEAVLLAADRAIADRYGASVAIDDQRIVVGAPGSDPENGAAYVYRKQGEFWTPALEQRLAIDSAPGGHAASVALSGDHIGISHPQVGGDHIFAYQPAGWAIEQELPAYDGGAFENYSTSVSLDGEWLAVGAPWEGNAFCCLSELSGRVYLYRRTSTGWQFVQQLDLTSAGLTIQGEERFGESLALHGTVLVVGAPRRDTAQLDAGIAVVFRLRQDRWEHEATIAASDARANDTFGASVDIDTDVIVVGAPTASVASRSEQGLAYVYERIGSDWVETRQISSQLRSPAAADRFGTDVAIDGVRTVIGAAGAGYAEIFERSGNLWTAAALLESETPVSSDFGASVAIDGTVVVVGAPGEDEGRGAAYRFMRSATSNTWPPLRFVAVDADQDEGDGFGTAVDLRGSLVAVGAPYRDVPAALFQALRPNAGATYLFAMDAAGVPSQFDLLLPSGGTSPAWFGAAIDLDGDRAAIGAPVKDNMFMQRGEAIVASGLVELLRDGFE